MVVLDTYVVSETMRAEPSPEVMAWMDGQTVEQLFVTAVTEAKIRSGVAYLPEGARRRGLAEAAERAFYGVKPFVPAFPPDFEIAVNCGKNL